MESNTTQRELSRVEIAVDEPHFDEATLLSARPVVPLEVVEAKASSGRRWALGLAIVVALLIGAFGATLLYKLRAQEQTSNITEAVESSQPSQPSIEAGVAAVESPESVPAVPRQEDVPAVTENTREITPPVISREPRGRASSKAIILGRQDESREEKIAAQRELKREMRRAEKWEERRLRRVERAARRAGDHNRRSSDDLSRIREIFEGAPRP
ncbi:MAG: hypothetical protein AABN95_26015 [Acidobacteriota bacterium]